MEHKLSDEEIEREMRDLKGWERHGDCLSRTFDRATFRGAVAFLATLSELAERAEHHPDIDIRQNRVKVMLTTHDLGGISMRDILLARQIQAAAA